MIVVDANVIAYLFIEGEHSEKAKITLKKDPEWIAPLLWSSEFRNVLAYYIKKDLMTLQQACIIIEEAESFIQGGEYKIPSSTILELCQESGCTAYDCEYAALARELGIRLITCDQEILKNFPEWSLSLEKFTVK